MNGSFSRISQCKIDDINFPWKILCSYVSITPRNLQVKRCICCVISLSTSANSVRTKFCYISLSKILITWIFANFNVKHVYAGRTMFRIFLVRTKTFFLFHCNMQLVPHVLCPSNFIFIGPIFIFVYLYFIVWRLWHFASRFPVEIHSSWFFIYFIPFSCIESAQFLTFKIHIAIYLLQRCLNFVAKMLRFSKKICLERICVYFNFSFYYLLYISLSLLQR